MREPCPPVPAHYARPVSEDAPFRSMTAQFFPVDERLLSAHCSNPLTAETVDGHRYRPVVQLTLGYQNTAQCSAEKEHAALISAEGQELLLALIRTAKTLRDDFRSIAQRNFCMVQAEDLQATRAIDRPSASIAA